MSETNICMSKISTNKFWKHLQKIDNYSESVKKAITKQEEILPYIHTWDFNAANSKRIDGKAAPENKLFDTGINTLHFINQAYDELYTLLTRKRPVRRTSQNVYLYQAELLANLLVDQALNILNNEVSGQFNLQSHMTMRAYRIGGIEGTLHAVALILNINMSNNSFKLDIFDSNGEFRKLYLKTSNEFICCVKDITGLLNGFELLKPSFGINEALLNESRIRTVNWFKKFIPENQNSAIANFGLVDICLSTINLSEIKRLLGKRYTDNDLKNLLKNSYVELNFSNYNALAFMVENYSASRAKYFILTRKEKKVKEGQINPITDFIEMRQYEVFMDIFSQILNKKIDEVLKARNIFLEITIPNIVCNLDVCNDGINIRGGGCNTWVLFYHWIRINYPNDICNNILKRIVNLESANVSLFEKKIYNVLEKQSKNYNNDLMKIIDNFLFSRNIKILNKSYSELSQEANCLFGGSFKKIKKIEKKKKKSVNKKSK